MGGLSSGHRIARATVKIGLANIRYSMKRAVWLTEQAAFA